MPFHSCLTQEIIIVQILSGDTVQSSINVTAFSDNYFIVYLFLHMHEENRAFVWTIIPYNVIKVVSDPNEIALATIVVHMIHTITPFA